MTKFNDRLKRLHMSRVRALDQGKHEGGNRVFVADEVEEFLPKHADPPATVSRSWSDVMGASRTHDVTIVDTSFSATHQHGRYALNDALVVELPIAIDDQQRLFSADHSACDLGFFDIESAGLARGDVAFCIGVGWWNGNTFMLRQFALEDPETEREMLEAFAATLAPLTGLVSFNGTSFDIPRLNARFEAHGLDSPFPNLEHIDLLHVARRFLPRRTRLRLADLERSFVMFYRHDDVPGSEAPVRWKAYLDAGCVDPTELAPLFEHNRSDILSLAALLAHFDRLVGQDPPPPSPGRAVAKARPPARADNPGSLTAQLKKTYRLRQGRVVRPKHIDPQTTAHIPQEPTREVGTRVGDLRRQAATMFEEHRFEEAVPILHEMIALSPRNPYPVAQLARYYRLVGDESLAQLFEERLKGLAPY